MDIFNMFARLYNKYTMYPFLLKLNKYPEWRAEIGSFVRTQPLSTVTSAHVFIASLLKLGAWPRIRLESLLRMKVRILLVPFHVTSELCVGAKPLPARETRVWIGSRVNPLVYHERASSAEHLLTHTTLKCRSVHIVCSYVSSQCLGIPEDHPAHFAFLTYRHLVDPLMTF